ncbi:MAG: TolC family protein [Janthinobacterium lividum]
MGERLTLEQAIARAQGNEPLFVAAAAERKALALERTNAKATLLPTVTYHNLAIYTKPNGVPSSRIGQTTDAPAPAFIANNAVREYASQGLFDEKIGLAQFATIHLADANAARAAAELEIARRGLVATVVNLFYGTAGGTQKVDVAVEAKLEAEQFLEITQKREAAREVAHADVLKAQLQQQSRERELTEAEAAVSRATVELGVLLYPDPGTPYQLQTTEAPLLPGRASIETLARNNNPEIRSALAGVAVSQATSAGATAALFPDLALNFTYGIDATNFGVNGPNGIRNLGYSMSATLDIPVWNWLSTERSIKAAHLRETAARTTLSATQRRLLASLSQFYTEAEVASRQLASLNTSVVTAREALRLTRLRYLQGESNVLEVVDAQSTLIAAQNAEIDGQLRYRLALANLQTLTGTL